MTTYTTMEIGVIGLGKMGSGLARRLARGGARVVAFDRLPDTVRTLAAEPNIAGATSLTQLCSTLAAPRVVLMMLPAGGVVDQTIAELRPLLGRGDVLIDGGNSYYRDSQRRAADVAGAGISYVDSGISGGIHGLDNGFCIMTGGSADAMARVEPFVRVLAPGPDRGWIHCGPSGAGHYAKMVHNAIEYGMMQAFAEGFALIDARSDLQIDAGGLAEAWRHGSVVRSWLLDLCAGILNETGDLSGVAPVVADSGEGRWAALESVELGVPTPVMAAALASRFVSQGRADYANRMLAMMRARFGGHPITTA